MRKAISSLLAISAATALGVFPAFAAAPGTIAIRNARVVTVSGPVLQRGTIVIRDGLIEAVGEQITVPSGAWVIEGDGLTVYPGLMTSLSTWGIPQPNASGGGERNAPAPPPARGPEDRPATTSWLHAADLIQSSERRLEAARSAGFTTSATFPVNGIIAGHGAIINLAGETPGSMVVTPSAGLYMTMNPAGGPSYPGSLMGVIAYIRQVFLDAEHYQMLKADYEKSPAGKRRPAYDRALEGVLNAPRILLPAVNAAQIERMLRFAAERKIRAVLYGGHEAYRTAEALKQSGAPILLNASWPERDREADPDAEETLQVLELRENAPSSAAALAKAGVPFAFYASDSASPRDLLRGVKKAIDAGLPADRALRALTLSPAEIYGVADRLGSIEKGKIANLLVTKGDLFQERTRVQYVFIDGNKYEPAAPVAAQAEGAAR
jgi:Imidazolonepropionase and related amidohydrolases